MQRMHIWLLVGEPRSHMLHHFSSVTQLCLTLWKPIDCSTPGLPVHHQFPEFTQTHVHQVGDAIQPSHPLSSPSPPALNLSQHQGLFKWVSSSHQVARVLELGFNISPSNEHSGLISFRMDWLDLLAVQGTPKSLLQHHSSIRYLVSEFSLLCDNATTKNWSWEEIMPFAWESKGQIRTFLLKKTIN